MEGYYFPSPLKKRWKKFSKILSTASYFPEKVITNQDIIEKNVLTVTDTAIKKTLGVSKRRVAEKGISDSDLLTKASRECLEKANISVNQLSHMIINKFLGDHTMPMTACMVQRKLEASVAFHCFDIEGGIASSLYALDMANCYINTGDTYVLISSGGIHQSLVDKTDPRVAFLFGDGAASILLGPCEKKHFLASYFYSNYEYYQHAQSTGLAEGFPEDIFEIKDYSPFYRLYTLQNWKNSIDFYLQAASVTKENLLNQSGLSIKDIDFVLITENNKTIRDMILSHLGFSEEKSLSVIEEYGNTMSAMLPILIDKAFQKNLLQEGMNLMLLCHGEGASGGGIIYQV